MKDCGNDDLENVSYCYPLCCEKHSKEVLEYAKKQYEINMKSMLSIYDYRS